MEGPPLPQPRIPSRAASRTVHCLGDSGLVRTVARVAAGTQGLLNELEPAPAPQKQSTKSCIVS